MSWKSTEPARLQEMARHFREYAAQTRYSEYVRLMTRAADDLESLAAQSRDVPDLTRRLGALEGA